MRILARSGDVIENTIPDRRDRSKADFVSFLDEVQNKPVQFDPGLPEHDVVYLDDVDTVVSFDRLGDGIVEVHQGGELICIIEDAKWLVSLLNKLSVVIPIQPEFKVKIAEAIFGRKKA